MPGILQQNMQAEQEPEMPMEQEPEMQGEQEPETKGNAPSPQSQEAYDRVVAAGMKVLYEDPTHAKIMQMLKAGSDSPEQTLAQVVVLIVSQLDAKAGGKIPRNVIIPAASELIALVAELAQKAGFFQVDDKMIQRALAIAMKQFMQKYGGGKQNVQAMMQRMGAKPDMNPMQAEQPQAQPME